MWLTKLGEKLNVLRWMVGGERKFEMGWDTGILGSVDDIGLGFKLLQSKPLRRRIGECTSN